MLEDHQTPTFEEATNCTTDVPTWFSINSEKPNTHPAEKITKLIRLTFFPVITDFRLPMLPAIAPI